MKFEDLDSKFGDLGSEFEDLGSEFEDLVSVSGFGSKFGMKLKSGGVGFRIWVEIWNEIETK